MLVTLVFIACTFVLGYYVLQLSEKQIPPGCRLPNGPKGKPFIGNLLDVLPYHSWLKFWEWGRQYGPLYRLNIAGRNNIIVSTEEIANDLLRERGNIYSNREQLPMAAQLLSDHLRPLFLPYGDTWRQFRKLVHNCINATVAATYEPVQEEESIRAVWDLIKAPQKYETSFERFSAGLIARLAYSKPIHTGQESFVTRVVAVNHTLERIASPGSYLVDTFPSLMLLPSFLAPFRREAVQLHAEEIDLFRGLLKWYKNKASYGISDDLAAYTIGTLFEAGVGTTAATMASFLLAMTLHADEFSKLQEEVDDVVGTDRPPLLSDIPKLPRVRAVAKEPLRWRPVTAGGLPHMLIKDDIYDLDGQKIFLGAGANIHPVEWSIHREPKRYPDADNFRPERWLEKQWPTYKEPLTQHPNLQNFSCFGFGRRTCAGQNLAERSLYILIARIAWACDISQKLSSSGNPILPPTPKPFDFDLKARPRQEEVLDDQYSAVWNNGK